MNEKNSEHAVPSEADASSISPYVMKLDLRVLDHLGLRLYSNVAAVLSEAVANAWDADTETVAINMSAEKIVIEDNGVGMDLAAINERFLFVGYDKRAHEGARSAKDRLFMGRKGIGKLSLFSIADVVTIHTVKNGEQHAFRMATAEIEEAIRTRGEYRPAKIDWNGPAQGTRIVLTELRKPRVATVAAALRKRIARRFSIIGLRSTGGDKFDVIVDGSPIGPGDRDDLKNLEFIWMFGGERDNLAAECPQIKESFILPDAVDASRGWHLKGWLGAAPRPTDLRKTDAGSMNGIVVVARGRLIQENILDKLDFNRLFNNYVTGQVEADFLDVEDSPDIATSDRQRLIEDDERYVALLIFLRNALLAASDQWTDLRNKHRGDEAIEKNPALEEWISGLPAAQQQPARKMLGLIEGVEVEKSGDRKSLYRAGVLAFERMRLQEASHLLGNMAELTAEALLPLLADLTSLEGSMYRDIIKERLAVIKAFTGLVEDNDKEKVLQQSIFDNMWLLDPGWDWATGSERMEQRLKSEYAEFADGLDDEKSKGRLDIRYRTNAGQHIIVELKRAGRVMKYPELIEQGAKYKLALEACVRAQEGASVNPNIQLVFVLGREIAEYKAMPEAVDAALRGLNARVVYYEQLIGNSTRAYREFLEKSGRADRIEALVSKL